MKPSPDSILSMPWKKGNIQHLFPHKQVTTSLGIEAFIAWEMKFNPAKNQDFLAWGKSPRDGPGMNPYGSQIFIGGVWEASGSIGEGAEWMFGDHRAASHMTFVSMTTPNIHKVFPAIQKLPKRAGRGEDFKINYIREEFPLSRAVTQKKWGGGRKEDRKTWAVLPSLWVGFGFF